MTYVYADQVAVLGPLATFAEPHTYDLCPDHANRLTAPRGWEVIRLAPEQLVASPSHDDLVALAEAVREAGARIAQEPRTFEAQAATGTSSSSPRTRAGDDVGRRGHLRVLRNDDA